MSKRIQQKQPCPFDKCPREYVNSRTLKEHLRSTRGSGYDTQHPQDNPKWQELDEKEYLKVYKVRVLLC
jgi:hypothetical protein